MTRKRRAFSTIGTMMGISPLARRALLSAALMLGPASLRSAAPSAPEPQVQAYAAGDPEHESYDIEELAAFISQKQNHGNLDWGELLAQGGPDLVCLGEQHDLVAIKEELIRFFSDPDAVRRSGITHMGIESNDTLQKEYERLCSDGRCSERLHNYFERTWLPRWQKELTVAAGRAGVKPLALDMSMDRRVKLQEELKDELALRRRPPPGGAVPQADWTDRQRRDYLNSSCSNRDLHMAMNLQRFFRKARARKEKVRVLAVLGVLHCRRDHLPKWIEQLNASNRSHGREPVISQRSYAFVNNIGVVSAGYYHSAVVRARLDNQRIWFQVPARLATFDGVVSTPDLIWEIKQSLGE